MLGLKLNHDSKGGPNLLTDKADMIVTGIWQSKYMEVTKA